MANKSKSRVLLSGTSNSLIAKGINASFSANPAVTKFTNQTYGASGTVAIGDHLRNIDFSKHDFCVLDYWVNESVFIWQKESTTKSAINSISAMIDAASIAGCKPIAIIFPDQNRLTAKRPFEDAVKDNFRSRGIPVFDSYKFAERIMAASNFSYEELFLNPMHIRREIGKFMGEIAIKFMQSDLGQAKPQITKTELTYHPLSFLPHENVRVKGTAKLVQRETRLLKTDVLRIEPGARIHLSVDGPVEVIGLTCNAARTIGDLKDGKTGEPISKIASSALFSEKRSLTLVSLPLINPLLIKDDEGVIEYVFNGETKADQPAVALELQGFVLRHIGQDKPVHIAVSSPAPLALEDLVTDDELIALIKILEATPAA